MTDEQIYVLKTRMKEGPQYVKYFMVDTLLEQNQKLTKENNKLKNEIKLLEERNDILYNIYFDSNLFDD